MGPETPVDAATVIDILVKKLADLELQLAIMTARAARAEAATAALPEEVTS